MMNRWFDKGVDGFRMDVISIIAKHPALPDGPGDGYVFTPEYFAFQPKLHEYLREMRQACLDGRECMCVGETSFVNTRNANSVVGDAGNWTFSSSSTLWIWTARAASGTLSPST